MNSTDIRHLRAAIQIAEAARLHGNHPFGAILVDENNAVLPQQKIQWSPAMAAPVMQRPI